MQTRRWSGPYARTKALRTALGKRRQSLGWARFNAGLGCYPLPSRPTMKHRQWQKGSRMSSLRVEHCWELVKYIASKVGRYRQASTIVKPRTEWSSWAKLREWQRRRYVSRAWPSLPGGWMRLTRTWPRLSLVL